jgi:hypothetical protein
VCVDPAQQGKLWSVGSSADKLPTRGLDDHTLTSNGDPLGSIEQPGE